MKRVPSLAMPARGPIGRTGVPRLSAVRPRAVHRQAMVLLWQRPDPANIPAPCVGHVGHRPAAQHRPAAAGIRLNSRRQALRSAARSMGEIRALRRLRPGDLDSQSEPAFDLLSDRPGILAVRSREHLPIPGPSVGAGQGPQLGNGGHDCNEQAVPARQAAADRLLNARPDQPLQFSIRLAGGLRCWDGLEQPGAKTSGADPMGRRMIGSRWARVSSGCVTYRPANWSP